MRKVLYCKTIVNKEVEFWESYSTTLSEMDNKGYFHQFVIVAEESYALIETEDGLIVPIRSDRFKFIDSPEAIDWEQRRYEIAREQMAHGVIPRMAVNDADSLIEALKGETK